MVEKTIGNKKDDSVIVNYTLADSCADTTVVGATSSVSWLTAIASTPSNHAGTITITATEDGSNVTRYAFVTPSINGEPCDNNRIKVTQSPGEPPEPGVLSCYRGTDNGTDYFKDGTKKSHPILLCGEVGSYMTDSIYVSGGLQYYTGSSTPTEDSEWKDLTETFLELEWVKLRVNKNGGCCGSGYIEIYTSQKYDIGTDGQRSASIWLRAKDRTIQVVPECAGQICSGPAGEQLCRQWEYEIKQCSVGYVWCGEHSTDATPIPCSEKGTCVSPREIKPPVCNCDEPSTCTCDELIVSGKTISYEAKNNIQIGSYSINCITNISATSSSKDWVTSLSVNNGKIFAKVTENESTESARTAVITVTGKAESNTCTKTFTLIQNKKVTACTTCEDANIEGLSGGATAEGGTNILIGSFSYSCDPGLTAKRVSGGDFITNMTVSNGNVYGTVSPNTATTPRTEDIGIYVGTSKCAQYTLTQQGATPSTCTCQEANVQVGTTAITLGNAAYSTANTTYSHDCTVYINNDEAEGWLDVNATGGKLEFNSISQATSERSANVYIEDIDGRHCETIKVTQEGPVHTYSFKFKYYDYEEGPMVTGDYNRYTGYDVTDFEIDGQPATMQVEVYYRRSFYDKSVQDCTPTSAQNYTGGTSATSTQTYDEGTEWCGGSLIHVNGFMVKYNGIILKQMQGHDSELDGTYEGEFS